MHGALSGFWGKVAARLQHSAVLWGVVLLLAIFGRDAVSLVKLSFERHRLDRRLARVEASRTELTALEDKLKNNPVFVEDLIRSTFKFSAPGELVIPGQSPRANRPFWQTTGN